MMPWKFCASQAKRVFWFVVENWSRRVNVMPRIDIQLPG